MRPILNRGALRAASRLWAANQQSATTVSRQTPARACTSSAVSSDPSVKSPTGPPAAASTQTTLPSSAPPPKDEPLSPLDEHAHPLPAADVTATAPAKTEEPAWSNDAPALPGVEVRGSSATDPAELLEQLRELLSRNAVRSALFHFSGALKRPSSPAIDPAVLKLMLPVLGRQGWATTSLDVANFALDRSYNLGSGLYNCALHAMARSGDYAAVSDVIHRMWTLPSDSRPNATSYNYLIGTYMYRGSVDQAFDVLNKMKEHLIYPTFATYHALITGCLRSHDPKRAYSTLAAVEGQRFDVGAMTITQVLVACAQADLVQEALDLLNRANDALPRYKSEVHRIAETRFAYRMARLQRTTPEERAAIRGDPRIEMSALHEVMQCAFRNGSSELAMSGWNALQVAYPDTDREPHMWYCLIGAFAAAGDYSRAMDALGMMREDGIKPQMKNLEAALIKPMSTNITLVDEQYYRLVNRAKGKASDESSEEGGVKAVESALVGELSVEAEPKETVDVAAEETAEVSEALGSETVGMKEENDGEKGTESDTMLSLKEVLSKRNTTNVQPLGWEELSPSSVGIDELNAIIWACSVGRDLDRAFQTYDEVEQTFNLNRNIDTFNALLEGCIEVRHVRGGMRIMTEMENAGLPATADTVNLMTRLLTRATQVDDAIQLVNDTITNGGKVATKTISNLLRYLIRGDSMEKAAQVYNIGIEAGFAQRALLGRLDGESMRKLKGELGILEDHALEDGDDARSVGQSEARDGNFDEVETQEAVVEVGTDDDTEKAR